MLIDEFGDGWDGLWLYINHTGYESPEYRPLDPRHHPKIGDEGVYFSSSSHAPSFESNPLLFKVCASLHQDRYRDRGHYILEIRHDPTARNNWEILWQVSTLTKDYNDWVYGDHKTRVEYQFGDDGLFHLEKVDRPLDNPNQCSSCTHPPPPPKPSDENSDKPPPPPPDSGPKPPPVHPVPFELGDTEGDGWFSNWLGARYSITDKSKTKLLDSGSICGPHDVEICQARLPDGDYYFRVGGAVDENNNEVTWKFCGNEGKAMQELSFAIIHGNCVPGHLSNAASMIGAKEQTTITLKGEVLLENVFSNELSTVETRIFESVIAQELGIDADEVMIISVCETRPGVYCSEDDDDNANDNINRRSLSSTYVLDVVFVVSMVAEKYNKIGSQYRVMKDFVDSKADLFDKSLRSGQLQSNLRSSERESLAFVRLKHFRPLKKTEVSYKFVSKTVAPTPVPHSDELNVEHVVVDESLEQAALLLTPLVLVGLAILGIAFVVTRERWLKQQKDVLELSPEKDTSILQQPSSSLSSELSQDEGATDEISFELRSDLTMIPSDEFSRSRYRPKEGSSLSHDDIIPMLNIRAGGSRPVSTNPNFLLPGSPFSLLFLLPLIVNIERTRIGRS